MPFSGTLLLAAPELILAIAALVLLVWGAFAGRASAALTTGAIASLAAAALATCLIPHGRAFAGGLISDQGATFAKVGIYAATALAVLLGDRWLSRRGLAQFEYQVLLVISALGMGMMTSAGDLLSLYVSLELQSLAFYILAAFRREDAKSTEAGLKYFILGALSSGLLLYGVSLIYGFAGSVRFDVIASAVEHRTGPGVLFGMVFLIAGLAFKISAAPFHMWTPDVYEGAPTPVVAFFAGAPKLAAMVLISRVLTEAFGGVASQWRELLILLAISSVAVGAFAGLAQSNLKRLWAYSSIANVGYALLGLAAGGAEGVHAMLLFMVFYVIDVTGFFACLSMLSRDGRPVETVTDLAGLMKDKPVLGLAMTTFSVSRMGLPPFAGFWGKFFVFKAAIDAGMVAAVVIALIGSVVAAFYYLRLVKVMWMDPSPGPLDAPAGEAQAVTVAAAVFGFPAVLAALAVLDPLAQAAAAALVHR
jgi:NADH-quinone oxidoreductase subunit N